MRISTDMALGRRDTETLADKQAQFDELIAAHRGIVFKVAHSYALDAEDRRDLAQEIASQAWRAFPRYDDARKFSTWLYRIALNVAITFKRNASYRHRHVETVDPDAIAAMSSDVGETDDRLRELMTLIARLDVFSRALVMLYLEGYDHSEIAEILGMTETNVATRLSRLKARLREERNEERHGTR